MKNILKVLAAVVFVSVIGFSMLSCGGVTGGGTNGILTINGLPESAVVLVCPNTVPGSMVAMFPIIDSAIGAGVGTTSPYSLVNTSNNPFTRTGTFMVLLTLIDSEELYYLNDVSFSRGSATINFSDMNDMGDLPLE